jgi:AcrR family transcriptional regulator
VESQNAIPAPVAPFPDVATRIAQRTMARRGHDYASEVRRLLDAGLEVMRRCGTSSRPRVADIVAAAGLSNDAFYRHFASKDDLVVAILQDGTERLMGYLSHQMAKEPTPAGKLRRWVEGVLAQAVDAEVAAATLAVLWNASGVVSDGPPVGRASASGQLATLLHEAFAALGSSDPVRDASLVSHAIVGALADHLWARTSPTRAEIDHMVAFCLRAVGRRPPRTVARRRRSGRL